MDVQVVVDTAALSDRERLILQSTVLAVTATLHALREPQNVGLDDAVIRIDLTNLTLVDTSPATSFEPQLVRLAYDPRRTALTKRESEVLDLLFDGKTNREVGEALGITSRTVEIYRANIYKKLRVRSVVMAQRKLAQLAKPSSKVRPPAR